MGDTKKYVEQLNILYNNNDLKEILNTCDYLRKNEIHILKDIINNHKHDVKEIIDIIYGHYHRNTTLKHMFTEYNFPLLKFKYPNLKYKRDICLLQITSMGPLDDGVFPKNYNEDNNLDMWQPDFDNNYLYPQILDLDFCLKDFYVEDLPPSDISLRYTQRELAERYYIRLMKYNEYSYQKIVEFIDNKCEYKHASNYHYKYYTSKNNRCHDISWYDNYVNKVYKMIRTNKSEPILETIHCKSIYNMMYHEHKISNDMLNNLLKLDDHINTNKQYFNLIIGDEVINSPYKYHIIYSSEGSAHDYCNNEEYFVKAFELFKKVIKL